MILPTKKRDAEGQKKEDAYEKKAKRGVEIVRKSRVLGAVEPGGHTIRTKGVRARV